jgi:peptidyl-prolyl cis-trans isomerase B (cyclophilin B)
MKYIVLLALLLPAGAALPVSAATEEVAVVETEYGDIVFRFLEREAPRHVKKFKKLARQGFFDGSTFYQAIPESYILGGNPLKRFNTPENGQPWIWQPLPAEIKRRMVRGSVAAFREIGNTTPGGQSDPTRFYILPATPQNFQPHTVFGEVIEGLNIVDKIARRGTEDARDEPIPPVVIKAVYLSERESAAPPAEPSKK